MIESFRTEFRRYRALAEKSVARLDDPAFFARLDPASNPIAVLVKHLGGNLRSRFTEFLTSDGEKPWRERDSEFEVDGDSRTALMAIWDQGWAALESALDELVPADLERSVEIRGHSLLVADALARSVAHVAAHVGQITLLAKHWAGERWESLSIAKGDSGAYNLDPTREKAP